MRQGPCTEEVGPCKRKWASPVQGREGRGPVQGPPVERQTHRHTRLKTLPSPLRWRVAATIFSPPICEDTDTDHIIMLLI